MQNTVKPPNKLRHKSNSFATLFNSKSQFPFPRYHSDSDGAVHISCNDFYLIVLLVCSRNNHCILQMKPLSLLLLENDFTCYPNHIVLEVTVYLGIGYFHTCKPDVYERNRVRRKQLYRMSKSEPKVCGSTM